MASGRARIILSFLASSALLALLAFPSAQSPIQASAANVLSPGVIAETQNHEFDEQNQTSQLVNAASTIPASWTARLTRKSPALPSKARTAEISAAPVPMSTLPAGSAATQASIVHVGARAVNLRTGPAATAVKLFVLQPGQEISLLEVEGGWVQVATETGQQGWVSSRYLEMGEAATGQNVETAEIAPDDSAVESRHIGQFVRLNASAIVRARPSKSAPQVFVAAGGQRVAIIDAQGRWLKVSVDGLTGWVLAR